MTSDQLDQVARNTRGLMRTLAWMPNDFQDREIFKNALETAKAGCTSKTPFVDQDRSLIADLAKRYQGAENPTMLAFVRAVARAVEGSPDSDSYVGKACKGVIRAQDKDLLYYLGESTHPRQAATDLQVKGRGGEVQKEPGQFQTAWDLDVEYLRKHPADIEGLFEQPLDP